MADPDQIRLMLIALDGAEAIARGNVPSCAGCLYYWEGEPDQPFRIWGWCRVRPPVPTMLGTDDCGSPTVGAGWFCGAFKRGNHPQVTENRKLWRARFQRELKAPESDVA